MWWIVPALAFVAICVIVAMQFADKDEEFPSFPDDGEFPVEDYRSGLKP